MHPPYNQNLMKFSQDSCILFSGYTSMVLSGFIKPQDPIRELRLLAEGPCNFGGRNNAFGVLTALASHYGRKMKVIKSQWEWAWNLLNKKPMVFIIEKDAIVDWLKDSMDGEVNEIKVYTLSAQVGHAVCIHYDGSFWCYDSLYGRKYKVPHIVKNIFSGQIRKECYLIY